MGGLFYTNNYDLMLHEIHNERSMLDNSSTEEESNMHLMNIVDLEIQLILLEASMEAIPPII